MNEETDHTCQVMSDNARPNVWIKKVKVCTFLL